MFKMARLIVFVGLGIYLGLKFNETSMRSECDLIKGAWQNGVCLVTELPK